MSDSHGASTRPGERRRPRCAITRRPAVPAAWALGLGILADRTWGLPFVAWAVIALALGAGAVVLLCQRKDSFAGSLLTLLCLAALSGARSHVFWSVRAVNDISAFCREVPQLAAIRGTIETSLEIVESPQGPRIPPWMEMDRTQGFLICEELGDGTDWRPVSGRVRLQVSGHLVHVRVGDRIEVLGELSAPGPPMNPGAFDARAFLFDQGAAGTLRADHPFGVRKIGEARGLVWSWLRAREAIRDECQRVMAKNLDPDARAIASSLLIGDRTMMTDELRMEFVETGSMHVLAISGMHVVILLGLLTPLCGLMNLSRNATAVVLIAVALLYLGLTNHQPSVLRAVLVSTIGLIGGMRARTADGMNLLAVCAIVLMLWSPADLFNAGAQLSFLAVGAILWFVNAWEALVRSQEQDRDQLIERPAWQRRIRGGIRACAATVALTVAVWFATLPLTASLFHMAAPIGMLLNLVLVPISSLVLGLGYLFLLCGLLAPPLAPFASLPFEWSLDWFRGCVQWGHQIPGGYFYLPDSSRLWVWGFYLLLAGTWGLWGTQRLTAPAGRMLLVWTLGGLSLAFLPTHRESLRCTVLSVGHGLAVLLELPDGTNLAYDAGTTGDGRRAERALLGALWERGERHLDALIISHADHDHYGGAFGVLEKCSVGSLLIGRSFVDPSQRGTLELCELASRQRVPIRMIQAGDRLRSRGRNANELELRILHPDAAFESAHDNANSLVLDIRYAGRRILLTGDLEKEGLEALLEQPSTPADLLLAPHHGGRAANVPALYDWARPDVVVVSAGRQDNVSVLENIARGAHLFSTHRSGAVIAEIHANGELVVKPFLQEAR